MKKRIISALKFISKELFVKYLFCYILSIITILVSLWFDIKEPGNSWLISFSASIFSLPVIFVIYTLYTSALEKQTREKITQRINNHVISIFARYMYFTEYFYYTLESSKPIDEDSLNNCLKYSSDEIFNLISDNVFSGIFLFSEFDSFDEYIHNIINEPIVCRYANQKDISILIDFINSYNDLKDIFNSIGTEHFIVCGKYDNIDLQESQYVKNSQGKLFYDAMWILGNEEFQTFFSAMYPLYEKEPLLLKFKISGTKAKEIAYAITKTYKCINKWLSIHTKSTLFINNAIVMNGRLHIDYEITYNQYMQNNIAIRNQF